MFHRRAILGDRHAIANWSVANAAALVGLTLAAEDVGKVAWQEDEGLLHYLADPDVPTWVVLNPPAEEFPVVHEIPAGGTTGQILAKVSDTDYDVQWIDAPTGGGGEEEMAESHGTWTPSVKEFDADTEISYTFQEGNYHRIGNRVFCNMRVGGNFSGAEIGDVYIEGLPFNSVYDVAEANLQNVVSIGAYDFQLGGIQNGVVPIASLQQSSALDFPRIIPGYSNASGTFNFSSADLGNDSFLFYMSFSYQAIPV